MKADIRLMAREDKEAIMQILRNTPEFNRLDVRVAEEVIDCYLSDPVSSGYTNLVAEVAGRIAGYVSYGLTPLTTGTWYVYWIAVAPQEKRHGIGGALLGAAEEGIKAAGGYLILIETSGKSEYENTRCFYEGHGYHEASRIKDFYAPGDDRVTFEKRF